MQSRREVVFENAKRHRGAAKREKGEILESLVGVTGYSRDCASYLLGLSSRKCY